MEDEFKAHEWGTDLIDELYRHQAEEMPETTSGAPGAVSDEEYGAVEGPVRLDEVIKGYD